MRSDEIISYCDMNILNVNRALESLPVPCVLYTFETFYLSRKHVLTFFILWMMIFKNVFNVLAASLSIRTIERKRVFLQTCRLFHLSVCQSVGRSVDPVGEL